MDKLAVSFDLVIDEEEKEESIPAVSMVILNVMKIGTTFGFPYLIDKYFPLLVMMGEDDALVFTVPTTDFPPVSVSVRYVLKIGDDIDIIDDPLYSIESNSFENLQLQMLEWVGKCRVMSREMRQGLKKEPIEENVLDEGI